MRVPIERSRVSDGKVWLGIRPEKVLLTPQGAHPEGNSLGTTEIVDVSFVGVSTQYLLRTTWGQELMAFEQNTGAHPLMRRGDRVDATFAGHHAFLLDHAQDARAGVDEVLSL